MADAEGLNPSDWKRSYGFESRPGHRRVAQYDALRGQDHTLVQMPTGSMSQSKSRRSADPPIRRSADPPIRRRLVPMSGPPSAWAHSSMHGPIG